MGSRVKADISGKEVEGVVWKELDVKGVDFKRRKCRSGRCSERCSEWRAE